MVEVTAFPDFDWFNYSLYVNITAEAVGTVSAGASGTYKNKTGNSPCSPEGFCLTNYYVSESTVTGTVTFEIGPFGPYSATSGPITLTDAVNVSPSCS